MVFFLETVQATSGVLLLLGGDFEVWGSVVALVDALHGVVQFRCLHVHSCLFALVDVSISRLLHAERVR